MSDLDLTSLPDDFFKQANPKNLPNLNNEYVGFSNLQLLQLQLRQVNERLVEAYNKPRPSYNVDGQEVKHTDYIDMLRKHIRLIKADIISEEGPTEETTVAWR